MKMLKRVCLVRDCLLATMTEVCDDNFLGKTASVGAHEDMMKKMLWGQVCSILHKFVINNMVK